MRTRGSRPSTVVAAASGGFLAGAIAVALVIWGFPNTGRPLASPLTVANRPIPVPPPASINATSSLAELRDRHLEIPVRGVLRQKLVDSFDDTRDANRKHEAIDIMAPRNTPILAVEEGTIARLFASKAGGTTIYQFDPARRYAYYYAHLERYADGLREGDHVRRGQMLGYVGTSGNAANGAPHLHFAIFRLTERQQWWHGTPIDPYEVLK
jgi:murein DD-endopeptidase MepM/ murein hydrolase activator NlpD